MATGIREAEELEITRVEKVLMLALVVFLLIGAFWTLEHMDNLVPVPVLSRAADSEYRTSYDGELAIDRPRQAGAPIEETLGIPPLQRKVDKLTAIVDNRAAALQGATRAVREADRKYQFGREEFRTGIEAGRRTAAQDSAYLAARHKYESAIAGRDAAQVALNRAQADLDVQVKLLEPLKSKAYRFYEKRNHRRDLLLFFLHFSYAGVCFWASWRLWKIGRAAQWRFLSILTALVTTSVIQLMFLAFRYCWELLQGLAQLGVAVLGSVGCILAIMALKRYVFNPERLARARLAGRSCPNCNTQFDPGQAYCWDCGRALLEPCPHCGAPHLRHSVHCASCGGTVG